MTKVLTAVAVMVAATLAQHLGLAQAIARVANKIAGCNMCCTFWASLFVLVSCTDANIHEAALLSILVAYLSNWFVIVLIYLQNKYNKIWQKTQKKK